MVIHGKCSKGVLILSLCLLLVSSCFFRKPALPPPEKNIAFCTTNAERVKGRLFYGQLAGASKRGGEIQVTGKLIFDHLKGWCTREPVPSHSYWAGDMTTTRYSKDPAPFYSYWTGDERRICEVPTLIRISAFKDKRFDVGKLNLEYDNPDTSNNVILSGDNDKKREYFHLSYDAMPLVINRFEITEAQDPDIKHCIVIYASFSSEDIQNK